MPVQTAKQMGADIIIAVDVSSPPKTAIHKILALLDKTFAVIPNQANAAEIKLADVVIRPAVGDIGTTNTVAREATIKRGNCNLSKAQRYRAKNRQKFQNFK